MHFTAPTSEDENRLVLKAATAVLSKTIVFDEPLTKGASASLLIKYYLGECMDSARTMAQHYVKVFSEVFPTLLEKLDVPLTPQSEVDTACVMRKVGEQLLYVLSGADPLTEHLTPLEELGPGSSEETNAVCFLVPIVGYIRATHEIVVSFRISFSRKNDAGDFVTYGARTILAGRHYGREDAYVKEHR